MRDNMKPASLQAKQTSHVAGLLLVVGLMAACNLGSLIAPDKPSKDAEKYALRVADSFLERNPDFVISYDQDRSKHKWHYEQGLMLSTLYQLYQYTADSRYLNFIHMNLDLYVDSLGQISTYKPTTYKLDDITPGVALLQLYAETSREEYRLAADRLHEQLLTQPRTNEGGFWHKQIYPYQMWLDGLYMASPFSMKYEKMLIDKPDYDDVVNQFVWAYSHLKDEETGLLYHGWDESREQAWADSVTGRSPSFWSRGMGWYAMALVDVLEDLPQDHWGYSILVGQLNELSSAVLEFRDPQSKLWYQVTDQGNRDGNYLESSASAMFIYAFAKGANKGWVPESYLKEAQQSFDRFVSKFVIVEANGLLTITQTCSSAGLGGKQNRDGSYEYYLSEPIRSNDCKAIGPFILAALELNATVQGS